MHACKPSIQETQPKWDRWQQAAGRERVVAHALDCHSACIGASSIKSQRPCLASTKQRAVRDRLDRLGVVDEKQCEQGLTPKLSEDDTPERNRFRARSQNTTLSARDDGNFAYPIHSMLKKDHTHA